MQYPLPSSTIIEQQVIQALAEDLGGDTNFNADITACLIPSDKQATATIITREPCVMAGLAWADKAFQLVDSDIKIEWRVADGDTLSPNTVMATLSGPARGILTAERTALNFLQTLSATATETQYYANLLSHSDTKILDTRKTLPGLRLAQKYAVLVGGGTNHRIGLYDAYLIKENHIFACGSISKAVAQARELNPNLPVEVEVESINELEQALSAGADIVMLDNFSNEQIQQAVALNQGRCKLEVSGNVTHERLAELATLGVDYISSGALTKNVKAIDLSLRVSM